MLKTKLVIILTGLMLLFSCGAFAADLGLYNKHKKKKELFPTSEFKIGYQGMYMYYDEPDVMHEKGILNGGFASWQGYFSKHKIMVGVEGEGVIGGMRYHGQYSDGTPVECDTDDYFISGRVTVGKGFEFDKVGLTPYIGFAGRYWYDKIKVTGGYERYIRQFYMPIGFNVKAKLDDGWTTGGTLEGDVLIAGEVKSKLSQVGSGYEDATNEQKFLKGGGVRVSAFLEYDFDKYALGVEPYFRYWDFAKSENDSALWGGVPSWVYEPKNNFYMSGLRLYIKF